MLARTLRLKRPQDFEAVRRLGKHWRDEMLVLSILPNELPHNRFGFVVSRRIGKAVVRNRIRRRLGASIRQWLPHLVTGYDVILVARPSVAGATYRELEASTGKLLRHAQLLARCV